MEFVKLNNGVEMPVLGYGVFQETPQQCEQCVLDAISVGYRLIDTAQAYYNEEGVGNAIAKSNIPRSELFITTKVWITNSGEDKAAASIDESLRKLQTDYVDLLLIHQPFGDYYGTYRAMETAQKAGKVRAIGVSNFYPDRFKDIAEFGPSVPAVNQVEMHIFNQQVEPQKIMQQYGTQIMAHRPFADGRNDFFNNETLKKIGRQYGKTVAQVALRFLIQRGAACIPKSTRIERMKENIDIFDFALSETDMTEIAGLDTANSLFISHYDASTVDLFLKMTRK